MKWLKKKGVYETWNAIRSGMVEDCLDFIGHTRSCFYFKIKAKISKQKREKGSVYNKKGSEVFREEYYGLGVG